ncbi:hypothetical protein MEA186_30951 [Mesorhizobium amorphae CCNWGS0123]|uniref:Uncharacterized protein n=1 Tax=Mesorhizobium amorphae CCNWGS0123 TaxID=1082933 RepID=G6YJL2_9HYPH|nr:hypothetical protein MEA186_30951 [Mesorhizobium amorphae CCNWGS0123]
MINQIRSFLQDRGITVPSGPAVLARKLPEILTDSEGLMPGMKRLLTLLQQQWLAINDQVAELEAWAS